MPKKKKEEEEESEEDLEELLKELDSNIDENRFIEILNLSKKSTAPVLEEITGAQAPSPVFFRTKGEAEEERDEISYEPKGYNAGEERKYEVNGIATTQQEVRRIDFQTVGTDIRNPHLTEISPSQQWFQKTKSSDDYQANIKPERISEAKPFDKPASESDRLSEAKHKKYEVR
ncbi:MAG: hypothetical protein ABH804_01345 [archaeon]